MPSLFDQLVDALSDAAEQRQAERQRGRLAKSEVYTHTHRRAQNDLGRIKRELEALHKAHMAHASQEREEEVKRLRAVISHGHAILRKSIGRLPAADVARIEARLHRMAESIGA